MVWIILHIQIESLRMGSFLNVYFNYIKLILDHLLTISCAYVHTDFQQSQSEEVLGGKKKVLGHTWLQGDNLPNPGLVIVGKELC